jgi:hypothetical protein
VRYLALFPFSSSHLLSLFGYIISLLSMIMGYRIGGMKYIHIHLYSHMTSLTDRYSFPYLANCMSAVAELALSNSVASCFIIYILHSTFVIYNSTVDSLNSQASLYQGSKKFQSICCCLPSPLTLHPSQCTLIMVLLVTTEHTGMKQLALTSNKTSRTSPINTH